MKAGPLSDPGEMVQTMGKAVLQSGPMVPLHHTHLGPFRAYSSPASEMPVLQGIPEKFPESTDVVGWESHVENRGTGLLL